jgi:hypothetical protein
MTAAEFKDWIDKARRGDIVVYATPRTSLSFEEYEAKANGSKDLMALLKVVREAYARGLITFTQRRLTNFDGGHNHYDHRAHRLPPNWTTIGDAAAKVVKKLKKGT